MSKHSLYDHCDVVTEINKEKNTVEVQVSFKEHVTGRGGRIRYTSNDVHEALQKSGIPAAKVVSGLYEPLDNLTTSYLSGKYVFSLVEKAKGETPSAKKPARTKTNK